MSNLTISISGDIKNYEKALSEAQKSTKDLEGQLASIGKTSAIVFAASAGLIAGFVNEARKVELVEQQYNQLTGSVEKTNKVLKGLKDLAAESGTDFQVLADAGKTLIGFGVSTGEVNSKLKTLQTISSATGANIDVLATTLGRVTQTGQASSKSLLALSQAGVNIGPALAEVAGVSEKELQRLVRAGQISASQFEEALNRITQEGGIAANGIENAGKTFDDTFKNTITIVKLFAAEVGKNFLPIMTAAAKALGDFFNFLRENPKLTEFIAKVTGIVAVGSGLIATLAGAAVGFLKVKSAITAAIVVLPKLATASKLLVGATGIGALLIIGFELYNLFKDIFPAMQAIFETFAKNISNIGANLGKILKGVFTGSFSEIQAGFDGLKNTAIEAYTAASAALNEESEKNPVSLVPDTDSELDRQKKNEAALKALRETAAKERRQDQLEEQLLKQEEDLLFLQENLKNEDALKKEAAIQLATEQAQFDKQQKVQRLKDEKQFGTEIAKFNEFIRSQEVQGAKNAANQLVALQQSKNSTLKGIGKAAAITNIAISTAEGAIAAYKSLAGIPIVGPALGAGAAAALIAFGGEQVKQVTSANTGGIIEGQKNAGKPNSDSVLAYLTAGELVVPRSDFDQVVEGAARERGFVKESENIDPDTGENLESEEGNKKGTTVNVQVGTFIGTQEFVNDVVIPQIRSAVQFSNANIGI